MEFLTSGFLVSLEASVLWITVLWISGRMGGGVLGACHLELSHHLTAQELRLFSVSLGLILVSLGILLLGLCRHLTVTATAIFLAIALLLSFAIKPSQNYFSLHSLLPKFNEVWEKPIFYFVILVFLMAWVQAMAPPIGNDALAYHLFYPKEFIHHHKIFYVPDARESLWPFQTEMLFLLGLLLQGTSLAQAIHYSFFVLTAIAIHAFVLRFFNSLTAIIAALIFVLCPAAFAQSGHAYVDLALAFYIFLAVYAFALTDSLLEDHAAVLSAIGMAGAVATKYLGLSAAFVLTSLWFVKSKARPKTMAAWIFGITVLSGLWYLRSWWVIGNPVYPFFSKIFGSGLEFDIGANVGMGQGWMDFIKFPWNLTMYPGAFGGESIGPLFLLFIPCSLIHIKYIEHRTRYFLIFTVFYTFILFKQSQHARFYLSIVPILSVATATSFSVCVKRGMWLRRVSITCLAAVLFLQCGVYAYRLRNNWRVVFGIESAKDYLLKAERSFLGYLYLKEHARHDDKIFNSAEVRAFYNESPTMKFDSLFFRQSLEKTHQILEDFLDQNKFAYIWLMKEISDPELFKYVNSRGYTLVYSYSATERPTTFNYLIFKAPV